MANLVIVTKQCYLIAESITYISVDALPECENCGSSLQHSRKKKVSKKEKERREKECAYRISVDFVPAKSNHNNNNMRNDGHSTVCIVVNGYDSCMKLFHEMVDQIREQMPDELWLNKLIDKFLTDPSEIQS